MYQAYSEETAHSINGVSGRLYARHVRPDAPHLFSAQKWVSERRPIKGYGSGAALQVEMRFDDQCKNGKASFSITGDVTIPGRRDCEACGCLHDDIARVFPELGPLIRWHLCATDGPMHYVANTVYHAGDRDHHGLRAGEGRQIVNGRTGLPCWQLEAVNAPGVRLSTTETGQKYAEAETAPLFLLDKSADCLADDLPPVPALRWVPMMRIGEGKERALDSARSVAIWPEATDEQLSAPRADLEAALLARLPGLLDTFRADMEAAGLLWEPIS